MQVLKPAISGAKGTIKREIEQGISELYQTDDNNLYVVLRREGSVMVAVAVAGSRLRQSRAEVINFARLNNFNSIRFHTTHPERLTKGLAGLPLVLVEVHRAIFGPDELVYKMELR